MKQTKNGRPLSDANPAIAHKIATNLKKLMLLNHAMIEAGFNWRTYYNWVHTDPKDLTKEQKKFLQIIEDAQEIRKGRMWLLSIYGQVTITDEKGQKSLLKVDAQGARWGMSRMWPQEFSENYIIKKLEKEAELSALERFGLTKPPETIIYKQKDDK